MKAVEYLREVSERFMEEFQRLKRRGDVREFLAIRGRDNIVIKMDLILEKKMKDIMREIGVPVYFIGEETRERIGDGETEFSVIADPLDGTRNFYRGIPFYGFSIGIATPQGSTSDDLIAGVVGDLVRSEIYVEEVRRTKRRGGAITGRLLISVYDYAIKIGKGILRLKERTACRTLGSVALEMLYVAKGFLDAIVEMRGLGRGIDIAGAYPHLLASGGILSDLNGREMSFELSSEPKMSFIAAGNEAILKELIRILRGGETAL